jgi:plasmid stabilization system protein ParE
VRVRIVVAPEAELDLSQAYFWYESRRAGLGEDFLSSVEASIERILRQPFSCPTVHKTYRRALIRRFPYAIFECDADTAMVYAVFHTSRDPEKWRQRLP